MTTSTSPKPGIKLPKPPMNPKRKKALKFLIIFFVVIGLLCFIYWLGWGRFRESTDDAYVAGNIIPVMPQVHGTVAAIYTDNTFLVKENQLLVQLDDIDATVALEKATADLASTVRQVRQYYENVNSALATVNLRQALLNKAQQDVKRRIGLVGQHAISIEEEQHIKIAYQTAQAQYDVALRHLISAIALVKDSHLYEHPLVEQAKANFKMAYLNWIRTRIYSPATGYIAKRNVQVGSEVNLGTALMAVIPLNQIWVDANYKESQLNRLRIGQSVFLKADAYSDINYHGKVLGLSPGTGSVFALLPPQNATGNWIKIVQRLPVRIALDPHEIRQRPLQLGLSMRVTTYTRGLKGELLSKTTPQKPIYVTHVYENQLAKVNPLIQKIVSANASDVYLQGVPDILREKHG